MKKLYLVDVSSLYFRAYYAIRPLSNSAGMPTNALYGFLSMTVKLLKQIKPDYLAFCFDNKEPSFRKEMYSEYKANRSEMPEDLIPQVPYIDKLSEALGIACFKKIGFEADDLIGTLTEYGRKNDLEVVIVSGDKDFAQLIQPFVSMYDTMKEVRYDEQGVIDKWGIRADQMIDYLAICGDASDNIPGVKGIGPKGAQKLLATYDTLEGIYDSIEEVGPKGTKAKLEQAKEMAFLSKELVEIKTDIELVSSINELKMSEVNRETLTSLLDELDFKSFEKSLLGAASKTSSPSSTTKEETEKSKKKSANTEATETGNEIGGRSKRDRARQAKLAAEKASEEIKEGREESRDSESLLSAMESIEEIAVNADELKDAVNQNEKLWGLWTERGVFFATEERSGKNGDVNKVFIFQGEPETAADILFAKKVKWMGYDLKTLFKNLKPLGGEEALVQKVEWDAMLAAYVLKAGVAEPFDDLFTKYVGGKAPELPTPTQMINCHRLLKKELLAKLEISNGMRVLNDLELPLAPILYRMESRGILLDTEELEEQSQLLTTDIQRIEKEVHEINGEAFNVASPKQLSQVLFDKMGIKPIKKTKTGFSTDNDVLEKLSEEHPIASKVIEFRELSKLKSTYVDALPILLNKTSKRLHTTLNQAHTATGRLSSLNPNLQNIPIRTKRGNRVRRAFVARMGHQLVSIDYSQIELRILAHITGDEGLCEAFKNDIDVHAATASLIYGVDVDKVTGEQRRNAKAVNFGIAYGQGAFGLAETLRISRKEASEIIGQYFNRFSKVREYMESVVETGKERGYVETIFGRRRILDELNSKNGRLRAFGERAAVNAPIQGAASDLVKKAMIEVAEAGVQGMLLQVHDELLFEIPTSDVDSEIKKISRIMESVVELKVPLRVNAAKGKNWEEAHA